MRHAVLAAFLAGCITSAPAQRVRAGHVDCTTSYTMPIAHTVAAVAAVAASLALVSSVRDDEADCGGLCPVILAEMIVAGPVFGVYAAHAYGQVRRCRETKEEIAREVELVAREQELRTRRDEAWQHTKSAAADARAGNCDAVRGASARVAALDDDFHRTVFLRDAGIARCLAP